MNIEQLCKRGITDWNACIANGTVDDCVVSQKDKETNERSIRNMMRKMKPFMEAYPKQKRNQNIWKRKGQTFLKECMSSDELFLMKGMNSEDRDVFYQITRQFIKDARSFDAQLSLEDIGQALRNMWIVIILQRIFGMEVTYHKAMFAYSMLYPYSDNYLDDPDISKQQKIAFNEWFTARLNTTHVIIHNAHEQQISDLIAMIEGKFSRDAYPQVYESLLNIQEAQIISLKQQDGTIEKSQEELTYISYRKGGTSVVADGCLIQGSLSDAQIQFCMEYGFMLQIGDDLQDGESDKENHHQTLVSTTLVDNLDEILYKLIHYTRTILEPREVCKDKELLEFVCSDCLMLLFLAVIQNEQYYTPQTYQKILSCMPVTYSFMQEMRENMKLDITQEELLTRLDCLLEDTEIDKY